MEVHPYYEGDQFATLLLMLADRLLNRKVERLQQTPANRKRDAPAMSALVDEFESVLISLYPPGDRHIHPVKRRLEALGDLIKEPQRAHDPDFLTALHTIDDSRP
jgi:hypothetical protein